MSARPGATTCGCATVMLFMNARLSTTASLYARSGPGFQYIVVLIQIRDWILVSEYLSASTGFEAMPG